MTGWTDNNSLEGKSSLALEVKVGFVHIRAVDPDSLNPDPLSLFDQQLQFTYIQGTGEAFSLFSIFVGLFALLYPAPGIH